MPGIAVNSELDNFNASVTYPIWFTPESGDLGVNVPTLITEWSVEARLGGIYVVRLIHILAASSGDWDNPLESIEPAGRVLSASSPLLVPDGRNRVQGRCPARG